MAREIKHEIGMKVTTVYIPYDIWEQARKEDINFSDVLTKCLIDIIKHPGFKKKINEIDRLDNILEPVNSESKSKLIKMAKKNILAINNFHKIWTGSGHKSSDIPTIDGKPIDISLEDLVLWVKEKGKIK